MRIKWECNDKKGGFPCCDRAFCVGLRFSFKGHMVSMMDAFEDLDPKKQALLGLECNTVEQILPNGAVLRAHILSSNTPVLQKITHQYRGEIYAEITVAGARIAVVNELRDEQVEG